MLPSLFRQPGGGGPSQESGPDTDSWFTSYNINEAYSTVVRETDKWREQVESEIPSGMGKVSEGFRNLFRRKKVGRFSINQAVEPRLYRLADPKEGVYTFEFMEVEGGGTSIKATYTGPRARRRIQTFKADMPVKISSAIRGSFCSHCGKAVLPDYKKCPYCGEALG